MTFIHITRLNVKCAISAMSVSTEQIGLPFGAETIKIFFFVNWNKAEMKAIIEIIFFYIESLPCQLK